MSKPKRPPPAAAAPEPQAPAPARSNPLWVALPALAAGVAYFSALGNGFVWDDPLVLRQLRAIHGLGDLIVVPPAIPHVYYRPVVFATYLVDRGLGGEQPFWFHASVVAWHLFNTLLVYVLLRRLFARDDGLIAACGALVFAVHPVHVESVSWMAGRSDVIACGFLLLAVLLHGGRTAAAPWRAGIAFLLSVLAKESVVLAGVLFPALDWATKREVRWTRCVPYALAVLVYVLLRQIGVSMVGDPIPPGWASPLNLVLALGFYLGKALLPLQQTVYANAVPTDALFLVLGGLTIAGVAVTVRMAYRGEQRIVLLGLGWCAVTLAPALILVLRRIATAPVAERYLYVPSVGLALLVAWLVSIAAERRRARLAAAVCAVLALIGIAETVRRNRVWSDDLQFWSAAAAAAPDALPQRELADAYLRRSMLDEAQQAYEAALERPGSIEERAMTLANLGNLYRRRGRADDAVAVFTKAATLVQHPAIYHGLGMALMRKASAAQEAHDTTGTTRAIVDARHALERALELGKTTAAASIFRDWDPAKTHVLLGQVLLSLGEREAARRELNEGLRLEPTGTVGDTARSFLKQAGGAPPP